ncbi:MAG: DUF3237 domain-containing protein [Burkholderiales bacterium]|nr:MAG: DUF3237 domain-containing protein [Burkholderiales bacterium]
MSLSLPTLEPIMQLTVQVAKPVEAGNVTHSMGTGKRRIIPITGGQVTGTARGQSMEGEILVGGADFQLVTSTTAAQLDARYILRLNDGSHIYITNSAIRTGSEQDIAALVRGESVAPERIYFRCAPRFEVERADLAWMTQTLIIGTGARFPDRVEMVFYEVK